MANRKSEHPGVYIFKVRKKWKAEWKDPVSGKPRRIDIEKYGAVTKSLARSWALLKSHQLKSRREKLALDGETIRATTTVKNFAATYLEHEKSTGGEKTRKRRLADLNKSFLPWLTDLELDACSEIDVSTLERYRDHLSALPEITNETRTRYMTSARGLIKFGVDRRFILVSEEDVRKQMKAFPAESRRAPVIHEPETLEPMIEALVERAFVKRPDGSPMYSRLAPTIFFLMLTGCRLQEALHARWEGVSWRRKTIRINEDPERDFTIKTKRDRDIGFGDSPALERLLIATKNERGPYILTGDDPSKPRYWSGPTWRRWRKSADLPTINPKDFRSTLASALAMAKNGPKPQSAAKRLGHSIATAENFYIDGGLEYEGDTVEEWLGIKEKIDWAMDQLGWPKLPEAK